jgi:phosphoribosylamine---glycine ligase
MRILIVGNGGREHALLWKLRRDAPDADFFVTRPNGGMVGACQPVDLAPSDVDGLAAWAEARQIDLTVVGPEAPLAAGIVDRFEARGLPVFGPSARAARIESSKAYAKALMRDAGIPTADHRTFTSADEAKAFVRERGAPIVVKASGLAAGKGAVVSETVDEATEAVDAMLAEGAFGSAGERVVIEEFMRGEELSVFVVTDGQRFILLEPSQDHKRVGEGDTGPNTGGMGAYAPVAMADDALLAEAAERIIAPTLAAMAEDGSPFKGLLYAGLMKTAEGLKVVEFNCRFGDPETQVVLPLLDASLLDLMTRVAGGGAIEPGRAPSRPGAAVTTVVASGGYPGPYESGKPITLPAELDREDLIVFHAGTTLDGNGRLVTSGGRVLAVTALAPTFAEAADASRAAAGRVAFEGGFFRSDIGWRERQRQERS